jgi:hypothetical protein
MKTHSNQLFAFLIATTLFLIVMTGAGASRGIGENFSVKEYNEFHEVLHTLQHEALPKKDFATIRTRACELTTLGEAIVKLGVPDGVKNVSDFEKELKTFDSAITKFKNEAGVATDSRLEESYLAVHDSFEMLASMLPKKK